MSSVLDVQNGISISTTVTPSGEGAKTGSAFRVINQMVSDGVIQNYAIGGATGAFFYIEPDTTYDVDIFCVLQEVKPDALDMLTPIYSYLLPKGYKPVDEAVNIGGVPAQFLPVFNELNEEAVEQARVFDYQGIPVRVMSPEYLVAIMLQTGRSKDFLRIARFMESGAFDQRVLKSILKKHNLEKQWAALMAIRRRLVK